MRDLWAVFGRICLDADFHDQVFSLAKNNDAFEQLTDLETLLRIRNNLCLGRWDIMEIRRCLTENFSGSGPGRIVVTAAEQDSFVTAIRVQFPGARPLPFPDNQSFCAAVGLTAVDTRFRALVLAMVRRRASPAELVDELKSSTEIHPIIPLTAGEADALLALIDAREPEIAVFHQAKWIVPDRIGCTAGYSPDAAYMHVSQPGAIALLINHPDRFQELVASGVVQGAVTQELFQQLHEEFLPPA